MLFTTLAPSGIVAYIIGAYMVGSNHTMGIDHQRLAQGLWMPILFVMVGLIASTTHLGNPANALYVLSGIGRSPLSNEVGSGVIFLGLAGCFWLYSFVSHPKQAIMRIAPFVCICAGIFFFANLSMAYSAETVITWNTPLVPAMLCANACVGGPMVSIFSLDVCRYMQVKQSETHIAPISPLFVQNSVRVSLISLTVNALLLFVYGHVLYVSANSVAQAQDLLPIFVGTSIAYIVCALAGIFGIAHTQKYAETKTTDAQTLQRIGGCIALIFVGIFLTRFVFYMAHMTVGVAI